MKIKLFVFSLFICIIILLLDYESMFAGGVTGTLAGYIKNKATNEPLIGAQVIIVDTRLGAATDKDGFYLINRIPAGTYTVKVTYIGYKTHIVHNVKITADQRTTMNFELEETVVEGEEIVVTAKRPLIQKNITSSSHFVEGTKISHLPVEDFAEAINLIPGVVNDHFRGGRSTEVLYLVDGIPIQEALRGGKGAVIPNNSIVEMTIHTGGFSAEYGKAMSGVVNLVTKEGGRSFSAYGFGTTDNFSQYVENQEWDNYKKYEFSIGGPIDKFANYFLSSDFRFTDTKFRNSPVYIKDYDFFSSPVQKNANTIGKLSFRTSDNLKIVVQGVYSNWNKHEYEHRWKYNLQGLPKMKKWSYRGSINLIHMISNNTYYNISLSSLNIYNKVFGKGSTEYIKVELDDYNNPESYVVSGDKQWWQNNKEHTTIGKFDLTSQLNRYHQLKLGLDFTNYDLYVSDVKYEEVNIDSARNVLGYNVTHNKYHYYPKSFAAFIQDKIEYEGFVANVGVRFDYFDPTAERPAIEIPVKGEPGKKIVTGKIKASKKYQISPRVGATFPITTKEIIHLSYGWFFQMPMFSYLFTNLNYDFSGYWPLVGDPDLKSEKTIAYEIGYQRILSENTVLTLTGFNKNIDNLVDTKTYALPDTNILGHPERRGFVQYVNLAYGRVNGLEIALEKRYSNKYAARISYTYMKALGSSSSAGEGYNLLIWGRDIKKDKEYPLSWDQRHTFVGEFEYLIPNSWGLFFIYKLNSPLPYTSYDSDTPNNKRMKWRDCLDIKFSREIKLFTIAGKNSLLKIYLEIKNLFNHKNILWVDPYGRAGGKSVDPVAYDTARRIRFGMEMRY